MRDVFSQYVARLLAGGAPPDLASYDEAREHLRALLVTEMRRRGLWTAPPGYLGVVAVGWTDRDALDELVTDAYTYTFVERLRGLADQLQNRPSIHGLVVRNVRNFLTDRQRRADPLGYRIFTRLKRAVERLLALGRLFVRGLAGRSGEPEERKDGEGAAKLPNRAVLAFSRELVPVAEFAALEEPTARWNDELLPELVTAEGRSVPEVVERLAEEVGSLPSAGVQAFRLEHLAKALKDDARRRVHAVWHALEESAPEDGEPGAPLVPVVRPPELPPRPGFRATVLACVEQAIAAVSQAKRRRDLWTVWTYLRDARLESEEPRDLPSYSALSHQLRLPRERVSQLFRHLKQVVRRCCDSADTGTTAEIRQDPATPTAVAVEGGGRERSGS